MGWQLRAECRGRTDAMFPTALKWGHDPDYSGSAAVCARCPVVAECLEDAMRWEPQKGRHGFRAGMTPAQRDRAATRRRQAVAS